MPLAPSLRSNFAWTFTGNAIYAAGQWAILSLLAKIGNSEMLGQYALAIALTAPVVMLSHLNLRAVIATDVAQKHPFQDYLAVRLIATTLSLVSIGLIARFAISTEMTIVILAAGIAQLIENVSDTYYGDLQRRERMDRIARSMMARAVVSAVAIGGVLWLTHNIALAVTALAVARLSTLLAYDVRSVEPLGNTNRVHQLIILRTALPLGVVLMMATLNTNLPRYAIERTLGTRELGAFAAVASFMTAGNTVINALGQAATPRLARYFEERDGARFRRLVFQLVGMAVALGGAGVLGAVLFGAPLLRVLYRAEFAQYAGLLTAMMACAVSVYVASVLGYVITSTRAFDAQLPLFCVMAGCCAVASWMLVPRFGLIGGPMALAVAACVQVGGELIILGRSFRRAERVS
jgi:O-antigen/teichoic acid export membrane protein